MEQLILKEIMKTAKGASETSKEKEIKEKDITYPHELKRQECVGDKLLQDLHFIGGRFIFDPEGKEKLENSNTLIEPRLKNFKFSRLIMTKCEFEETVIFDHCTFNGQVWFEDCIFHKRLEFKDCTFPEGSLGRFARCQFEKRVTFAHVISKAKSFTFNRPTFDLDKKLKVKQNYPEEIIEMGDYGISFIHSEFSNTKVYFDSPAFFRWIDPREPVFKQDGTKSDDELVSMLFHDSDFKHLVITSAKKTAEKGSARKTVIGKNKDNIDALDNTNNKDCYPLRIGLSRFKPDEYVHIDDSEIEYMFINSSIPNISFTNLGELKPEFFKKVSLANLEFDNVDWNKNKPVKKIGEEDRISMLNVSTSLKKYYYAKRDYEWANWFYGLEMDTKRKNGNWWAKIYKWISNYGRCWWQPLLICLIITLGLGIALNKIYSVAPMKAFLNILLPSMIFKLPDKSVMPQEIGAYLISIFQMIVGPILIALSALAIRNKVKK